MAFEDERSIQEIEEDIYEPYSLEYHEKQSVKEIKNYLLNNFYPDRQMIKDHIDFLQHLLFKIEHIRNEEQIRGHLTKELDEDVFEIKKLAGNLSRLYNANA